ncbi:MAG: hypothetical protein ABGX87_02240 [Alcanivorax sp.]|uniref:hypothetical protein n=1 Tax=Alloalcanivorax marinus TaxID=1177169 RepID=UPI0021CE0B12|nr:hypothetical protein [Alloalcanivorax marinus]MCU5787513.1 hypothetical protein [Alloalcanivorax marinus]
MFRSLAKTLVLMMMLAALAACGGGGGSSGGPSGNGGAETPNNPDNPDNPGDPNEPGDPDNPGDPDDPDNPEEPGNPGDDMDDEERAATVGLIDTNNHFTASVCPGTVLDVPLGNAIDVVTCENEALTNISLGNDNLLGLVCADTVAGTDTALVESLSDVEFLPNCVMESTVYLRDTITGLLDGTSPITQELCPNADNPVLCVVDVLQTTPETLQSALTVLGCEDALNPQTCLTGVANNLASGELLIGTLNTLSTAVCPVAANAGDFNPQDCVTEVLTGVGSVLNVAGLPGVGEICGDQADPLTCLLEAGELLSPVTDALGGVPVVGELVNSLLGAIESDPGNLDLLETLPQLLAGIPVVGDLIGDALENGGGEDANPLFALLEQLQGLPEMVAEVPVLGDLLNGLAGGDAGGLPLDALDLESLADALTSGDLSQLSAPVQEVLDQVPVLGPLVGQLLGAVNCESGDPLQCLTSASDQLGQFTDLLGEVPVLGDLLNPLIGTLLGAVEGGGEGGDPLATLTGALDQLPVAGDLLNEVLGTLLGGEGGVDPSNPGDLLNPALGLLEEVPVLGDLANELLGGLLSGGPLDGEAGLENLLGGLLDQDFALIPAVGDLLEQIPALGEPLVSVLDTVAGDDGLLENILSPIADVLEGIPGLGDLLGGLLDGLFGWT